MLYNKTKKQKIIEKVRHARGFLGMLKGLMFEKKERFDYALVFELPVEDRLSASIHTFFVFFPIDVVFLDNEKKVVDIAKNLKPFAPFFVPKKPAKYFIELPNGKTAGIERGNTIEW